MAEQVPISGGPELAKLRNPIAVAALSFFTFGIYAIFWWYFINRELADLGRKHQRPDLGTNPLLSALAIFPGVLLLMIPLIWTTVTTYQRAKRAQEMVEVVPDLRLNPWLYGIAFVAFSAAAYGYLQDGLNKVWRIDAGIVPQGSVVAQPVTPPPPPENPPPPPS